MIRPVYEHDASDSVNVRYREIKEAFGVMHVPAFFTYLGAFPEYLDYIVPQMIANACDSHYNDLVRTIGTQLQEIVNNTLLPPVLMQQWVCNHEYARVRLSQDVYAIYVMNIKLAILFIALREAIKGWAIAMKKLPSSYERAQASGYAPPSAQKLVYQLEAPRGAQTVQRNITAPRPRSRGLFGGLIKRNQSSAIEKNVFGEYLHVAQQHFTRYTYQDRFVMMRLSLERIFVSSIPVLPQPLVSPVNVVIQLTKKYPQFPELLHLLSDHFPTYAAQRVMFSGFLVRGLR